MTKEKITEATDTAREFADNTARQTKDNANRFQATVEDAAGSFQDSVQNSAEGFRELGLKVVDLSRSNANAHFDFLKTLFAAKSLDQAFEIQSSYLRDRSQALAGQSQELSSLTQQAMTKSVKPLQGAAERRARA